MSNQTSSKLGFTLRDLRKLVRFTDTEHKLLRSLNSPVKIQYYLDTLPKNFEPGRETLRSPRETIQKGKAHCIEAALVAAVALWYHGQRPLLLDLVSTHEDYDHVVTVFKKEGYFGAISKTNHAVLRYREPVYKSVRELSMSYFHEYFVDDGTKTMRSYSELYDLSKIRDVSWVTGKEDLWWLSEELDAWPHKQALNKSQIRGLRLADKTERKAGRIREWKR